MPAGLDGSFREATTELANSGLFDQEFYSAQVSEPLLNWDAAVHHYLATGAKKLLDPHPLFDTAYYLENNADVDFATINPLLHFWRYGWKEGRNPHPLLDVRYYLKKYKDVEELGIDPLSHYLFAGAREGRDPSPFFSSAKYCEYLDQEDGNPLVHFVLSGAYRGLSPRPDFDRLFKVTSVREQKDLYVSKFQSLMLAGPGERARNFGASVHVLDASKLFDHDFYKAQINGTGLSRLECIVAYLTGKFPGRVEPHPLFDTQFYRESNKEIDFQQIDPFVHFLTVGWKESRNPHPLFDIAYYLQQCPDVRKARVNALQHFMVSGAQERRNPCRVFNSAYYLKELRKIGESEPENLLLHFLSKRDHNTVFPHPLFELVFRVMDGAKRTLQGKPAATLPVKIEKAVGSPALAIPSPERIEELFQIFDSQLFDHEFVISQLGQERPSWLECANYYLQHWQERKLDPHLLFDTAFYVSSNPHVDFSKTNPLFHFISVGWAEDCDPHPLFDLSYYLKANKDVRLGGRNPIWHFLRFGALEGRKFSPFFDPEQYKKTLNKARLKEHLKRLPFACKKENYGRDLITRQIETERLKDPPNQLAHFLTEGITKNVYPSPNFKFFFDVESRPGPVPAAEPLYWRLKRRDLNALDQSNVAYRSLGERIAKNKLSEPQSLALAKLMNLLIFRKKGEGFLNGKRTIILATHEASRTGAPLLLMQLAKELASRDWECLVVIDRDGVTVEEFSEFAHVINFRGSPEKYQDFAEILSLLFDGLKFPKPDLAILNSLETGRFARPLATNGIKIISFVHELVDTYPRSFLKEVYEQSELVVYPARFIRDFAREKAKLSNVTDLVIPSALIDEDFGTYSQTLARKQLREEIKATSDSLVVLGCGTLEMRKGIDTFLHIAQLVLNKVTDGREVHFVWIGVSRMINHSPHYYVDWDIRQGNLTSRIHLLPARKDIRPAFRGADLFVLPSRQDPFPCVVHNAMAAELPVVAFADAGGVPEMLESGGAKIVHYGDICEFSDAILSYLGNEEERVGDGKINARLVRERFQFADYIAKIQSAIDQHVK
jgi:glycosyltransferase involved in cell wall biosynthesis